MGSSKAFSLLISIFIQSWSDIIKYRLYVENVETEGMLPSSGWLQYNGKPHYLDIIISRLPNPFFSCCVVVCSFEWLISSASLNLWLYSMKSEDEGFPQGFALPFIFVSTLYWMSLISASNEAGRWREGEK